MSAPVAAALGDGRVRCGLIYVPEPAQLAVLDKPRRLGDDLIFRSKRGRKFRQEGLHRAWAPVRDAFTAQLPDTHHLRERLAADPEDRLDFYELRHFGASYLLNVLGLEPGDRRAAAPLRWRHVGGRALRTPGARRSDQADAHDVAIFLG